VLISLALVMGTYSLAGKIHLSGPIAVVCAGLLIGERGPTDAIRDDAALSVRFLVFDRCHSQYRAVPADRP